MAASSPTPRKRTPRKATQSKNPDLPRLPLENAPTSAGEWKKGTAGEDLRVPSGNVCRIRRVGMREWVREDIIPDSLRPMIDQAISKGQGANTKKLKDLASDPSKFGEMFELMDRVVALVVSMPVVIYHRYQRDGEWVDIPMDDRDPNTLYTDEIDDQDKIYIFNVAAGGVRDLERFRQELGSSMGSLSGGEDLGSAAE